MGTFQIDLLNLIPRRRVYLLTLNLLAPRADSVFVR